MSKEQLSDESGLQPRYKDYQRQKCFIGYTEQTAWSEDLLSACQAVLSQPEFNLEVDYARKHFHPDIPLRQKALELIANARYGIYDLSFWYDKEQKQWQLPRNVFIELGIAIALNRPTLLLRHANNRDFKIPECLQSLNEYIFEFSGETTLKKVLLARLPQWINSSPEQDWWSQHCVFGHRKCEFRELHPQIKQWESQTLHCHISDGSDLDRPDFRGIIEDIIGRFNDVTYKYLDALSPTEGYSFLLCSHCQAVRSSPFAIYRITPETPAETYIAIGMSLALEQQFQYSIPKILLTEDKYYIPSLLEGYEVVVAGNDKDRKRQLQQFLPVVVQKMRSRVWKPESLPFIELANLQEKVIGFPKKDMEIAYVEPRILLVNSEADVLDLMSRILKAVGYSCKTASSYQEALPLLESEPYDLLIIYLPMPYKTELELIQAVSKQHPEILIATLTGSSTMDMVIEVLKVEAVVEHILMPFTPKEFVAYVINALSSTIKITSAHSAVINPRVLIIDDERDVLELCKYMLQSQGYQVECAYNGYEAIEIAKNEHFDLLCVDIQMSDVGGLETAQAISKVDPYIRVNFMTGFATMDMAINALHLKQNIAVTDFILKPFTPKEFTNGATSALMKRVEHRTKKFIIPSLKT